MEESSTPAAPWLSSTTKWRNSVRQPEQYDLLFSFWRQSTERQEVCRITGNGTFLLGECITGAGGEGGPRGIFLLILKHTIKSIKSSDSADRRSKKTQDIFKVFLSEKQSRDSYKLAPCKWAFTGFLVINDIFKNGSFLLKGSLI